MRNSKNYSNEDNATKVNLNKPLLILIKVFYYLGLSTFSETDLTNRYQKICHLKWCLIHLFYLPFIYALIFYYHRELFYIGDNFGNFNDFIKVSTVGISHLAVLIETVWAQQTSAEFFRAYSHLHEQWTDAKQTKKEFQIYKKFFFLMLFYTITSFLVDIGYVFQIHHKTRWILNFIAYMPSVTICRLRMIQISMYLFLTMTEALQLNKEILELAKSTKSTSIPLNVIDDMVYRDLSVFMRKYQKIYLMMELMKKAHSVSFLVIFIKSYLSILSDCYWSYWVIYNQDDVFEFAEYSLIIPTALNIFLTLIISKDCMSAAKLIPHSLHSVRHRVENLKLSYKIQNFSLQLRHQQIIFDAFGCFTVDCYIISGILSSITMYMIFYIQFMPKFKNL